MHVVGGLVGTVSTTLIALAVKYTIGWRIGGEDEVEGIDFAQHGETAYGFATGGGPSRAGSLVGVVNP